MDCLTSRFGSVYRIRGMCNVRVQACQVNHPLIPRQEPILIMQELKGLSHILNTGEIYGRPEANRQVLQAAVSPLPLQQSTTLIANL